MQSMFLICFQCFYHESIKMILWYLFIFGFWFVLKHDLSVSHDSMEHKWRRLVIRCMPCRNQNPCSGRGSLAIPSLLVCWLDRCGISMHEQSLWPRISIYKRLGFNWGQMHHDCIPFPVRRYKWLCPFDGGWVVDPECWGDLRLRVGESRLSWLNSDLLKSVCCKSLSRKLVSLSCLSSCRLVITLSAISTGNMSSWFCNQIKLIIYQCI